MGRGRQAIRLGKAERSLSQAHPGTVERLESLVHLGKAARPEGLAHPGTAERP